MTKISDSAIAGLAQGAGLSGDAVAIAVAIALAESGGDPAQVTNTPATGDLSYGLWQINMIGSMGPDRRRAFGLTDNNQLLDPATNDKVMSTLSSGGTYWNPWTTYTRGTYKLFLARGQAAASAPGSNGQIAGSGGTTTPASLSGSLSSLNDFFNTIQSPEFWKWAGVLVAGVALLFFGIMKATGDNSLSSGSKELIKRAGEAAVLA